MKSHELKCWPEYFQAIWEGRKMFDVRRGEDRIFEAGDNVVMREFFPDKGAYGRSVAVRIVYVMHGGPWLPPDVWVFGFDFAT